MDIADVRRRLRGAIDHARREAAERRARVDAAERDYEAFLRDRAIPVFHDFANALSGEGHPFKVSTPARSVRLEAARSREEFIELELDTEHDPPQVIGRSSRGRGRRMVTSERPVRSLAAINELTEEDVLAFLVSEIVPLVER
jgi:hypothetical protein